jgi:hypothetical protein
MAEIVVSGLTGFTAGIAELEAKALEAAQQFVTRGALIVESNAKKDWRPRPAGSRKVSKSGHVYYDGKPPYQAQRPQPTIRTGNTRNSIRRQYVRRTEGGWESGTGASTYYAPYIQTGTRFIHAPAFPFMETGLKNSEPELRALAVTLWGAVTE